MKTKRAYLRNTIMSALVPLSLAACNGMMPYGLTGSPAQSSGTVAQPGDEKLTCAQLAQESNKLTVKIRELDSNRKVANTAQSGAQMAEQAGQLASMTGGRGEAALPLAGVIGHVASSGAASSAANLETSYQAAVMRKQHVGRLAANKNCARK